MLKYRGQYRVVYETDKRTGKPAEFSYIPCRIKKGSNIARHNEDTLNVYIPSINLIHRLLQEHADIFTPYQIGDKDGTLLFGESDMHKTANILKPIVQGRNTYPKSKKNIRFA